MFSPQVVVSHLLKNFGSCDLERTPSRKEQKVIDSFTSILREAVLGNLDVEWEEDFAAEEIESDPLWEADDEETTTSSSRGLILFGDTEVEKEQVENALVFYRSSAKGSRSLSSMSSKFRFIRTEYHLLKLRQFEKEEIGGYTQRGSDVKLDLGVTLHDCDIRQMALKINKERALVKDFKAGHRWIQGFKRKCGIVSRHITTFCSRKSFLNRGCIVADAEHFVEQVKNEMEKWPLYAVCNADQSGFLKEMHTGRSLAFMGSKKVERTVQSVAATSHSFTVMPSLFADGHLGPKLFVVLKEASGEFPAKGHFQAKNLEVRANTTHMMSKHLLLDWVRSCVAAPDSPIATLLVVDSWSSFKDHDAIRSALPPGKQLKIMNIPPGATSLVQPLDVYFFLPFKAMYT